MICGLSQCRGRLHQIFVLAFALVLLSRSANASSSSSSSTASKSSTPISFERQGISKIWGNRYHDAMELARLEQSVEDYNALLVASARDSAEATTRRRLICMPLDDRFDPPMGSFSHGHVQNGDKISIPRVLGRLIMEQKVEVPYLFMISRVEGVTKPRVDTSSCELAPQALDEVIAGPLDFRAPANYCFLPWWMMRALGLHPRDVVDVKLITTVPAGGLAKLRPHSPDFSRDISNPQSVMETELRHYSSLTRGSAIAFDYNGKRYWFDVEELRTDKAEKSPYVKVQDCNLATDFMKDKETMKKERAEREARRKEREENE